MREIYLLELVPLGGDDQRLCARGCFQCGGGKFGLWNELEGPHVFHALGVVGSDVCSFGDQLLDEIDGHRGADIVRVALEGQAPDGDFLVAQDPEGFPHCFEEAFTLGLVDALDLLEQGKRYAELVADGDESGDVLGKAASAVSQAGVEEVTSDAFVHADAIGDLFHVRAAGLADGRDGVDVADLEREERVGGVLDEFGRVDVGD